MLMTLIWILLAIVVVFCAVAKFYLGGPNNRKYDRNDLTFFYDGGSDASPKRSELVAFLTEHYAAPANLSVPKKMVHVREGYEYQGRTRKFESELRHIDADPTGLDVSGEWTIPPNADPKKRILFLHGGAFMVGSAISHRPLTDNIARRTGCVVFAPNYRLGPEYGRKAGIADCKAAYKWILENGPDGLQELTHFGVTGDSAGGNLTLMLSQWARDADVRGPDAAVAMSPTTDSTGSSPSMRANLAKDAVLGGTLAPINKLPKFLRVWLLWLTGKINPGSPEASPLFGACHDLPPTLIQVSNTEVLYHDGCRFAEKARQAGSPVTLQIWRGQEHVWQHYDEIIPEAGPALDEIGQFFSSHMS